TLHESTAIIAVPNDFTRGQLEGRLRGQLEDALSETFGREIRLAVSVNPSLEEDAPAVITPDEETSGHSDMSTKPREVEAYVPPDPGPQARETEMQADRRNSALETRLN